MSSSYAAATPSARRAFSKQSVSALYRAKDDYLCKGNASVTSAASGMRAHSGRLFNSYPSS